MKSRTKRPAKPKAAAVAAGRTCIVCRLEAAPARLLRLTRLDDGHVVVGTGAGRGAWVCPTADCLTQLDGALIGRALRDAVQWPIDGGLAAVLAPLAHKRLFETLGLARRSGQVDFGADSVAAGQGGRLLRASDGSARHAEQYPDATVFSTMAELGQALGQRPVAVLRVRPGHLAEAVDFWLAVAAAAEMLAAERKEEVLS